MLLAATTLLAFADPAPAAPTPFVCCDDPALTKVVVDALALHDALTGGKGRPSTVAKALHNHLSSWTAPPADQNTVSHLLTAIDASRTSDEAARAAFADVGLGVAWLALRHEGGTLPVAEAACNGTSWLQSPSHAPAGPACRADWR